MRLLDLFCGAGGAAMGYHLAGFDEVVGVDIEPQPNYPFTFIQGDALDPPVDLQAFDLIHASPPCQAYTSLSRRRNRSKGQSLIGPTRSLLQDHEYIIENVVGAAKSLGDCTIQLTGAMFGLNVHRPRLFELGNWWTLAPSAPMPSRDFIAVYGPPDGRWINKRADGSLQVAWSSIAQGREAMEMPWAMTAHEIREAIPPAYTEYLGRRFLDQRAAA